MASPSSSIASWLTALALDLRPCISGGKSNAIMIANVAPGYNWFNETLRTLNFASKSRMVVNVPVVHVGMPRSSPSPLAPSALETARADEQDRARVLVRVQRNLRRRATTSAASRSGAASSSRRGAALRAYLPPLRRQHSRPTANQP